MPRGRHPKTAAPLQPVQTIPDPVQEQDPLSGLYLFGTVIDRTRRTINARGNTATEIVTYTIQDTIGRRYYVDEYSPEEYYDLNEYAEIPVYVKTFKKRTGDIGYSFCVQTDGASIRGERF